MQEKKSGTNSQQSVSLMEPPDTCISMQKKRRGEHSRDDTQEDSEFFSS
jgi:hypothetical protein